MICINIPITKKKTAFRKYLLYPSFPHITLRGMHVNKCHSIKYKYTDSQRLIFNKQL